MADVAPLRALTYDPTRVVLDRVVAPPYDVIDEAARAALAAEPHGFVHLDLPQPPEGGGDRYAAAAARLEAWRAAGILRDEPRRAVFRYHQIFEHDGRSVTRRGVLAGVRATPWAERDVRPHERTLGAPVADRLALLRATRTHLSPVFAAFRDPAGEVARLFRAVEATAPTLEARTADGTVHRVWRCADAELHGALRRLLAPRPLYVLDGHHRYETAVAYREGLEAAAPLTMYAAARYVLACLVPLDDPGLVVRPTHRLLHGLPDLTAASLVAAAAPWFDVEVVPGGARALPALGALLAERGAHTPAVAVLGAGDDAWLLALRPTVALPTEGGAGPAAVARLDVAVVQALLLERALGLTPAQIAAQAHVAYAHAAADVVARLAAGTAQVGLLLNATPLEAVRHVADLGERMPQKATYFFPKLASGLVMASASPDDDLL